MAGEEILTGEVLAVLLIPFLLFFVGLYVYGALAYQSIFRKSGYKRPWFAWIPGLNLVPILQLGGFHWAWVFLLFGVFIPETMADSVIGIISSITAIAFAVLAIVSHWRIFKKAGYAGALSLLLMVPIANYVILGIVAWQKRTYKKVSAVKVAVKKAVAKKPATKKKVVAKKVVAKKKVPSKKKK